MAQLHHDQQPEWIAPKEHPDFAAGSMPDVPHSGKLEGTMNDRPVVEYGTPLSQALEEGLVGPVPHDPAALTDHTEQSAPKNIFRKHSRITGAVAASLAIAGVGTAAAVALGGDSASPRVSASSEAYAPATDQNTAGSPSANVSPTAVPSSESFPTDQLSPTDPETVPYTAGDTLTKSDVMQLVQNITVAINTGYENGDMSALVFSGIFPDGDFANNIANGAFVAYYKQLKQNFPADAGFYRFKIADDDINLGENVGTPDKPEYQVHVLFYAVTDFDNKYDVEKNKKYFDFTYDIKPGVTVTKKNGQENIWAISSANGTETSADAWEKGL